MVVVCGPLKSLGKSQDRYPGVGVTVDAPSMSIFNGVATEGYVADAGTQNATATNKKQKTLNFLHISTPPSNLFIRKIKKHFFFWH
jgi:hypothetical protein